MVEKVFDIRCIALLGQLANFTRLLAQYLGSVNVHR